MRQTGADFATAVTASRRRIRPRAIVDLTDPNMTYSAPSASGSTPYSRLAQIYDKTLEGRDTYAYLELNSWVLDGSRAILPDSAEDLDGQYGWESDAVTGIDGLFTTAPWVQLNVTGLSVIQAAAVYFSDVEGEGVLRNFVVEISDADGVQYAQTIIDNTARAVYLDGFTVNNAVSIRVTAIETSIPCRRVRIMEIVPGIYEEWGGETVYAVNAITEINPDNTSLPYGQVTISIYNENKRFNPYAKSNLFASIQEGQRVPVELGVRLPSGKYEYTRMGVYYQRAGGWDNAAYGMLMRFTLVDIIGLLADRKYTLPDTLPTTPAGWLSSILICLGGGYADYYTIDAELVEIPLYTERVALEGLTCGQLLRYVAMRVGGYITTVPATGALRLAAFSPDIALTLTLDDLRVYPTSEPATGIASITFTLLAGGDVTVEGADALTGKNLSVKNPFTTFTSEANTMAAGIMVNHAGNRYIVPARGDPRIELGDRVTFATGYSGNHTAYCYKAEISYSDGIIKAAPVYLTDRGTP